jgi:thiol-disulfide isomerase/thioredoxin
MMSLKSKGALTRTPLILVLIVWLSACSSETGIPLLSGETLKPSKQDQWLLINYWATWCAPCIVEIPELNELDQEQDIRVIGVNFDQLAGEELQAAIQQLGIKFDVALEDPLTIWNYAPPQVLPATVMISPSGEVRNILVGPQTRESLRGEIIRLQ